jgi:hypothetical protein
MTSRIAAALLAFALVGAACGDEGGTLTPEEQVLADAILAEMISESDPGDPLHGEASARCIAEGLVGDLGVARLAELGIEAQNVGSPDTAFAAMTDEEIDVVAAVALGCPTFRQALSAEMTADGVSAESAECLVDQLVETGVFRQLVAAAIRGDSTDVILEDPGNTAALITAMSKCFSAEELEDIFGG